MAPLHMNDIIKSPLSKPKEEVDARNITFSSGEPIKPLSIKIDKTVNGLDGSKTVFTVSMEHAFTSAEELKAVLDAVGYCGKPGIVARLRAIFGKE